MFFLRLEIANFRNLSAIKWEPSNGFNILHGNNGSGKTSLLESVYYLSYGRSFRTSMHQRIIQHEATLFNIYAQLQTPASLVPIGVERQRSGEMTIKIAGQEHISVANLAQLTPTLLINSQSLNLLDAGPAIRRKYLDWGIFYLNENFLFVWRQYERVLKQRNAALRAKAPFKELMIWTEELVEWGMKLHHIREAFVQQLFPLLVKKLQELLTLSDLQLDYMPGWDLSVGYLEALKQCMERDSFLGFTQAGPHRGDLKLSIKKIPVKDILSRGQQKLFVCAMILAQGALLQQCTDRKVIYLVDDLPSELDSFSRSRLIQLLKSQETQIFLTAVEPEALSLTLDSLSVKMFHVEHGDISPQ